MKKKKKRKKRKKSVGCDVINCWQLLLFRQEEQKWLDALERGELDDFGRVKRDKDVSMMTARQVFIYTEISNNVLLPFSIFFFYKLSWENLVMQSKVLPVFREYTFSIQTSLSMQLSCATKIYNLLVLKAIQINAYK